MIVDFSDLQPVRKPTKKEKARYRRWLRYLSDSKLSKQEIHARAESFTLQGKDPKP